jgi:uncharacterized membrane protein
MTDTRQAEDEILPHADGLGHRYLERTVLLSDGVFAIAITLSALEIRPQHVPGQTLWQAWSLPLLVYAVAFLLVGGAWSEHRHVMARLARIDRIGTLLNLAFLGFVALLPIAVRAFLEEPEFNATIYIGATLAAYVCLTLLWAHATLVAGLAPRIGRAFARAWLLRMLSVPILLSAAFAYLFHLKWIALACALAGVALRLRSQWRLGRFAH